MTHDLTEAELTKLVDDLFDASCTTAQDMFVDEGGSIENTWVLVSPHGSPRSLLSFCLPMPDPGAKRDMVWNMLRTVCLAHDAVAMAHIAEVWRTTNLDRSPTDDPYHTEAVMVLVLWRSAEIIMQRTAYWPILRDNAGAAQLGEPEFGAAMAAAVGNITRCLSPTRPSRAVRKHAGALVRKLLTMGAMEVRPLAGNPPSRDYRAAYEATIDMAETTKGTIH